MKCRFCGTTVLGGPGPPSSVPALRSGRLGVAEIVPSLMPAQGPSLPYTSARFGVFDGVTHRGACRASTMPAVVPGPHRPHPTPPSTMCRDLRDRDGVAILDVAVLVGGQSTNYGQDPVPISASGKSA